MLYREPVQNAWDMSTSGVELCDYRDVFEEVEKDLRATRRLKVSADKDAIQELPGLQAFIAMEFPGHDTAPSDAASNGGSILDAMNQRDAAEKMDGFKRMERCRIALDALDRAGWKRSYFQVCVPYCTVFM